MKKKSLINIVAMLTIIGTLTGCTTLAPEKQNIEKEEMTAHLLYQKEDVSYPLTAFDKFTSKNVTESIVLLEVSKDQAKEAFAIVGDKLENNVDKLYYDTYQLEGNNDKYYIYYHILTDNTLDLSKLTLCHDNLKDDNLTKINIPTDITNVTEIDINMTTYNGKSFIYTGTSEECTKQTSSSSATEMWFTFIPLNTSITEITELNNIELMNVETDEYTTSKPTIVNSDKIMNRNTGNANTLYSPLNFVVSYDIEYDADNLSDNAIDDFIAKATIKFE